MQAGGCSCLGTECTVNWEQPPNISSIGWAYCMGRGGSISRLTGPKQRCQLG